MPWRERLEDGWQLATRLGRWLKRWARPPALALAILLTAGGTAVLVVRLMMLAMGEAPEGAGGRPASPQGPPLPPPAAPAETPSEARAHRRGLWVLGLSAGSLLVLVVAALVVQTLVQDRRPADYFQAVGARPMPAANLLQGYHWVDQNAGVVQIPIERAMDLLAQRGLPARSAAESQAFIDEGQGGPSDSSGGRAP